MGPRAGLDGCGKSRPERDSIPGPSSPKRVDIPTELSRTNSSVKTQSKVLHGWGRWAGARV